MTYIFQNDARQIGRWREQANRSAKELKAALTKTHPYKPGQPMIPDPAKLGFAFDDGVVTIELSRSTIEEKSEQELVDFLYDTVVASVKNDRT